MKNRLKSLLHAGDRIELHIDGNVGVPSILDSSLEAVVDNDKLVIQASANYALHPLHADHIVRLVANKDTAGILEMSGRIIQITRTGSTSVLVVELAADVHQTQRRQYFRLPILRDVRLGNSGDGYFEGITQNISAGGLRCVLPVRLRQGARITINLELSHERFDLKGEVLDAMEFNERAQHYILRIRFTDTTHKDQARLISYIFCEQGRQKKLQPD